MAIYHCSIKIISRGKGKSAVAAAAYRAGEKLTNDYDGITHDYTRKGGVVHTEILLPEHAPDEYSDRAVLWNAVEKIEKAANSQLAREIELALPVELTREQNIYLVREYIKDNFVDSGMCADVCVHDKNDGNPHTHIMLTTRPFNEDKTWGTKERKDWGLVSFAFCMLIDSQRVQAYDRPMRKIGEAAKQVAEGDFSVYLEPLHTVDKYDYVDIMFTDINKMVEELGSIETLKNDFIANVSHELKTPISLLDLFANPSIRSCRAHKSARHSNCDIFYGYGNVKKVS